MQRLVGRSGRGGVPAPLCAGRGLGEVLMGSLARLMDQGRTDGEMEEKGMRMMRRPLPRVSPYSLDRYRLRPGSCGLAGTPPAPTMYYVPSPTGTPLASGL